MFRKRQQQQYGNLRRRRLSSPERGRSRKAKPSLYSSRGNVIVLNQSGAASMNGRQLDKREQTPALPETVESVVAKLDLKNVESGVKEHISSAARKTIVTPPTNQAENEVAQALLQTFKTCLSYLFISFQFLGYFVYSIKQKV